MDVDPIASIAISDIRVEIGRVRAVIRGVPASVWLRVLMGGGFAAVVPGMLDAADADRLDDAMWDGDVTLAEVDAARRDVITVAGGRDWWWTLNLLAVCRPVWATVHGRLASHGFRASVVPLGAALDALYVVCAEIAGGGRRELDRHLEMAPPGFLHLDEEAESKAFLGMMNGM